MSQRTCTAGWAWAVSLNTEPVLVHCRRCESHSGFYFALFPACRTNTT